MDDLSFFDFSSPFCFLLIKLHLTYSISYKILTNYVYYYCIVRNVLRVSEPNYCVKERAYQESLLGIYEVWRRSGKSSEI